MTTNSATTVSFYHLSASPFEKALAAIMGKAYASNLKSVILTSNELKSLEVDTLLWLQGRHSFLPHALISDPKSERQPILISHEVTDFPNNPEAIVAVSGRTDFDPIKYKRVIDIFNGNDQNEVEQARKRWVHYKKLGCEMQYWFQDEKGNWASK
ncbi:MAG: DNA polymerase III subunit chi [Sphingobacteriia bacterium]|nr:DNA polymerase III subunit chi [Sphingobacteriia bacterium]